MTEDTSKQIQQKALFTRLRHLETTAYSGVISALRCQGELSWEKQKVLDQLRILLHISPQRHCAELLRSESDPLVQKIVRVNIHKNRNLFSQSESGQQDDSFVYHQSDTDSEYDYEGVKTRVKRQGTKRVQRKTTSIMDFLSF